MMTTKRLLLSFSIAGLIFASISYSAMIPGQLKVLPGSAARGEQLLFDKGCLNCHRLANRGGDRAPDLASTPPHARTPELLASAIWNHAPSMWPLTTNVTTAEAADIFAYMYSSLYFAPLGNAGRGKAVFQSKKCAACHSEGGPGPAVSEWATASDPIAWAGRMWNHATEMSMSMLKQGFVWPKLSNQDIADLAMYFRSVAPARSRSGAFGMGEPEHGRVVFEGSCESCHSFGPGVGNRIDLLERPAAQTVTGYIAAMWNHAELMRARGGPQFQTLDPEDTSHLGAFLFSEFYFFQRGNAASGRRVFEGKNCARCHEQRRTQTGAPDLTQSAELYSPITLTSAVWNHGPKMFEAMKQDQLAWPTFRGSEMADLIAYLNSRVIVRMAAPQAR